MTKTAYNHILTQFQGIEVTLILLGTDENTLNNLVEGLKQNKYSSHQVYLNQLATGLLQKAEEIEAYSVCTALKNIITKLNVRNDK